jgi:hypothetical protein
VAARAQLVAHFDVVVDLAVLGQRDAAAFIVHRHVAKRTQVQDAQALIGQRAAAERFETASVGSAVTLHGGHRVQRGQIGRRDLELVEPKDPGDAAHGVASGAPHW